MVDHRGVTLRPPVAQRMAGGGADQQGRRIAGQLFGGPGVRLVGNRDVPAHPGLLQSQRFAEAADRVEHMFAGSRRDAFVDHQAVQVLRAGAVVADAPVGLDAQAEQVRAQRHLHLQQRVETPPAQRRMHGAHAGPARGLVEADELHAGQVADQLAFQLADDPGQRSLWPRLLQGAHQRHHVGDVADGGGAQQADRGGGCHRAWVRIVGSHWA